MSSKKMPQDTKPLPPPKKYVAFAVNDNRSIEAAYQNELEGFEDKNLTLPGSRARGKSASESGDLSDMGSSSNQDSVGDGNRQTKGSGVKVPVNEDFLFDVDIENRELAPAYWLGPVYDVRRGSWFYQEGSTLRYCEENLAAQLEEGYLKAKPWQYPALSAKGSSENLKPSSAADTAAASAAAASTLAAPQGGDLQAKPKPSPTAPSFQPESHRLFGQYMSHVATYQDATTAWLSTDSMLSWVTSTMYERFSGGGYMGGIKVVRGYTEPNKAKDDKTAKDGKTKDGAAEDENRSSTPTGTKLSVDDAEEKRLKVLKRRSAPPSTKSTGGDDGVPSWDSDARASADKDKDKGKDKDKNEPVSELERRSSHLQRQLSSLMGNNENRDPEQEAEDIRQRAEQEMQDDYNSQKGETQGREIEHLVLVTHGIGQLLGLR